MKKKQKFKIDNGCLSDGAKTIYIDNIKVLEICSDEGANATVFKAYDTILNREVVLKIWCRIDRDYERTLLKAMKELSKVGRLSHPHIATIHYANIIKGYPIAIVDFLPGITLFEWIKETHSLQERWGIWVQISDSLNYCHALGVTHGDLHSKNIMINNNEAILFDFGSSIFASSGESKKRACELLIKLGDKLFFDLLPSMYIPVDTIRNVDLMRRAIDSIGDILIGKTHLRLRPYETLSWILGIVIAITDLPVFDFKKIESIITAMSCDNELKNYMLNNFYNHIHAHSIQKVEELKNGVKNESPIRTKPGIKRQNARDSYMQLKTYFSRSSSTPLFSKYKK
jgi:serine/threonine protein kinase